MGLASVPLGGGTGGRCLVRGDRGEQAMARRLAPRPDQHLDRGNSLLGIRARGRSVAVPRGRTGQFRAGRYRRNSGRGRLASTAWRGPQRHAAGRCVAAFGLALAVRPRIRRRFGGVACVLCGRGLDAPIGGHADRARLAARPRPRPVDRSLLLGRVRPAADGLPGRGLPALPAGAPAWGRQPMEPGLRLAGSELCGEHRGRRRALALARQQQLRQLLQPLQRLAHCQRRRVGVAVRWLAAPSRAQRP